MTLKLLWVDDDHIPERYEYEIDVIREDFNWQLTVATSFDEATKLLSTQSFDWLLLDLQLPVEPIDEDDYVIYQPEAQAAWVGCALLYWLRRQQKEIAQCPPETNKMLEAKIEHICPLESNINIPVLCLSMIHEKAIDEALHHATGEYVEVPKLSKPVNIDKVRELLEGDENATTRNI